MMSGRITDFLQKRPAERSNGSAAAATTPGTANGKSNGRVPAYPSGSKSAAMSSKSRASGSPSSSQSRSGSSGSQNRSIGDYFGRRGDPPPPPSVTPKTHLKRKGSMNCSASPKTSKRSKATEIVYLDDDDEDEEEAISSDSDDGSEGSNFKPTKSDEEDAAESEAENDQAIEIDDEDETDVDDQNDNEDDDDQEEEEAMDEDDLLLEDDLNDSLASLKATNGKAKAKAKSSSASSRSRSKSSGGKGGKGGKWNPKIKNRFSAYLNRPYKKEDVDDSDEDTAAAAPAAAATSNGTSLMDGSREFDHHKYDWLRPDKIRDAAGRPRSDPNYDPSTLYVPERFMESLTPSARQWWLTKRKYFDTVLLFKMGKFYELFHMDAELALEHLGLLPMGKGSVCHAGFPEHAYHKFAERLANLGFNISRVEQTETPEMKAMRKQQNRASGRKATKDDDVVRREVVRLISAGTRIPGIHDPEPAGDYSQPILAIVEAAAAATAHQRPSQASAQPVHEFGVCLLDAAEGIFRVGQFEDTADSARLFSAIEMSRVAEFLLISRTASPPRSDFLAEVLGQFPEVPLTERAPATFWPPADVIPKLREYYETYTAAEEVAPFPSSLLYIEKRSEVNSLALRALGGMIDYLRHQQIDIQMITRWNFSIFSPHDVYPELMSQVASSQMAGGGGGGTQPPSESHQASQESDFSVPPPPPLSQQLRSTAQDIIATQPSAAAASDLIGREVLLRTLILDGISLRNLDIVRNRHGKPDGTLYEAVNFCRTAFGRRGLTEWLQRPLNDLPRIAERQEAVRELTSTDRQVKDAAERLDHRILDGLPDLKRLLAKIHNLGVRLPASHPERRAIMFSPEIYNVRKMRDFIKTLSALRTVAKLPRLMAERSAAAAATDSPAALDTSLDTSFRSEESGQVPSSRPTVFQSSLLRRLTSLEPVGDFPDLLPIIRKFEESFDLRVADQAKKIIPKPGTDEDYDGAVGKIRQTEQDLEDYLAGQVSRLGGIKMKWYHGAKLKYQLEVSEADARKLPDDYKLESTKKGSKIKRYSTPEIAALLLAYKVAEEERDRAAADQTRKVFARFDTHYPSFAREVDCLTELDVLLSGAKFYKDLLKGGRPVCFPEFSDGGGGGGGGGPEGSDGPAELQIVNGVHPVLVRHQENIIPNSLTMANDLYLITGPNMGGKSTLMRLAALTVILAQMGYPVAAEAVRLSPVDQIFTRLGSSDNIIEGESTFYVELKETSKILSKATRNSLVVLDELGRGTSTYDGIAIAGAVIKDLISPRIHCRTLFSTHYHSLVAEMEAAKAAAADEEEAVRIKFGYMEYRVNNVEDDEDRHRQRSSTQDTAANSQATADSQEDDDHITFLYKFVEGICSNSFGFNVARLANIGEDVIAAARAAAAELHRRHQVDKFLKKALKVRRRETQSDAEAEVKASLLREINDAIYQLLIE